MSQSSPHVELLGGSVSEEELAAIAVAVAGYSALSREEARERELTTRAGTARSSWNSPIHRHASASHLRTEPRPDAWVFSHR